MIRRGRRQRLLVPAAAVLAAIVALQVRVLGTAENLHAPPSAPEPALMVDQKRAGIGLSCDLLHGVGRDAGRLSTNVAAVSFAMVFLHPVVIHGLEVPGDADGALPGRRAWALAVASGVVTGLCMAVVHAARAAAGRRTRYVLGA
ncbi:MAG: hypothetical protein ACLFU0_00660 [Alphaproteobacteria bacterium]